MKPLRIFISSPGDVAEEREKARQVIAGLQARYEGQVSLLPVLWEDLAIPATASFQEGIDFVLAERHRIDIAVFVLWSRLGSPLGAAITKADGSSYRSGTEREFDLMLAAFEQSGRKMPVILAYTRDDNAGFNERLDARVQGEEALEEILSQRKLVKQFIRENFQDKEGHNLRAYHSYCEPVAFAQRLHVHLRGVIDDLLELESTGATWTEAPYRSLEVFDIRHAPIFCGRDEETCDILQRLRDQQRAGCAFVCIVGASGSGKSSLARAGVAATLVQRSFDEGVKEWRTAVLLPSLAASDLFLALARILAESLPELRKGIGGLDEFTSCLREQNFKAASLLMQTAFQGRQSTPNGTRILIILDQMEELWTSRSITAEQREHFLQILEALARSGHVAVLATLRSDFYPQAQLSEIFLRMKGERGHFDLIPPGPAALQQLIVQPARRAGLRFERDETTGSTLDQRILKDAAADPSALPLLQYALAELYEHRDETRHLLTFAAYEAMGGVEGALGRRAAQTFDGLPDEAQAALEELLPLLISVDTAGEQNAVRRRSAVAALTSKPARRALSEALIKARFLTTDEEGGRAIATLAHEALLRRWDRITAWINTNRDLLRMRARIEQYQAMWEGSGRDQSRLLPAGLALEEGRQLLEQATQLLDEQARSFVTASMTYGQRQKRRSAQRRRAAFAALSALTCLAGVAAWVATHSRQEADVQRALSMKQVLQASRNDYATANERFTRGEWRKGISYLGRSLSFDTSNTHAFQLLWHELVYGAGERDELPEVLMAHPEAVQKALYSPDGKKVLTATTNFFRNKGTVRLWDAVTGRLIGKPLEHDDELKSVEFSPDGSRFLTAVQRRLQLWDTATGNPVGKAIEMEDETTKLSGYFFNAAFSADGSQIVAASNGYVRLIDARTGMTARVFFDDDKMITRSNPPLEEATLSPDGRFVVAGFGGYSFGRVWEVATGRLVGKKLAHKDFINGHLHRFAFSPDSQWLVTVGWDGTMVLWKLDGDHFVQSAEFQHKGHITSLSFSPDGTRILSSSYDNTVQMWDALSGEAIGEPLQHQTEVEHAAFSRDGMRIVSACSDGTVHVWDAATGLETQPPLRHAEDVNAAMFSPDGRLILTASDDKSAQIWDAACGHAAGEPIRAASEFKEAALNAGGTRLVTSTGVQVQMWNPDTGEAVGGAISDSDIAFELSPDGEQLLTRNYQQALVRSAQDGHLLFPLGAAIDGKKSESRLTIAKFSPDGARIITVTNDAEAKVFTVQLWDAKTGSRVGGALPHPDYVHHADFSANGKRLITWSGEHTANVWDAASGAAVGPAMQENDELREAALSPAGDKVVTVKYGGRLSIWKAGSRTPHQQILLEPETHITQVEYARDGRHIFAYTTRRDGTEVIHVWDEEANALAKTFAAQGDEPVGMAVDFSRDGTQLITLGDAPQVWSVEKMQAVTPPFSQEKDVRSAAFSRDGRRVATGSYFQTAQVWNIGDGQPVGGPFKHEGSAKIVSFSAKADRLLTYTDKGGLRIWDIAREGTAPVEELVRAVEAMSGYSVAEDGTLRELEMQERLKRRDLLSAAKREDSEWGRLLAWWLERPSKRTASPVSGLSRRMMANRHLNAVTPESIHEVLAQDPGHPLVQILAAKVEENELRAASLRRFGLARLPDDAAICAQAAVALEAKDSASALTAAEKALKLEEKNLAALRVKGAALAKLKRPEEALAAAGQVLLALPGDVSALRTRAKALNGLGKNEEVLPAYRKLVEAGGAEVDDFTTPAYHAAKSGQKEEADFFLNAGKHKMADSDAFARMEGWTRIDLGEPMAALAAFRRAESMVDLYKTSGTDLLAGLAIALWLNDQQDEAVKIYERLIGNKAEWATPEMIVKQKWPKIEAEPMEAVRAETLRRHPELLPQAEPTQAEPK